MKQEHRYVSGDSLKILACFEDAELAPFKLALLHFDAGQNQGQAPGLSQTLLVGGLRVKKAVFLE